MILLLFILFLIWYLIPTYQKPRVIPNFITDEEIEHIKKEAESKFSVSTVAEDRTIDKKHER